MLFRQHAIVLRVNSTKDEEERNLKKQQRFIIYGRETCPFCLHAIDYCNAIGAPSIFLDYSSEPEIIEEYKQFYKQETVPIILANDLETGETRKIGGYPDLLEYAK